MNKMMESETDLENLEGTIFILIFKLPHKTKKSSFYYKRGDTKIQKQIICPKLQAKSVADLKLPFMVLLAPGQTRIFWCNLMTR